MFACRLIIILRPGPTGDGSIPGTYRQGYEYTNNNEGKARSHQFTFRETNYLKKHCDRNIFFVSYLKNTEEEEKCPGYMVTPV